MRLPDFCFHDSKPIHFEHNEDTALLKLDYDGMVVSFMFTSLYDVEVNGDPTTNWIIFKKSGMLDMLDTLIIHMEDHSWPGIGKHFGVVHMRSYYGFFERMETIGMNKIAEVIEFSVLENLVGIEKDIFMKYMGKETKEVFIRL